MVRATRKLGILASPTTSTIPYSRSDSLHVLAECNIVQRFTLGPWLGTWMYTNLLAETVCETYKDGEVPMRAPGPTRWTQVTGQAIHPLRTYYYATGIEKNHDADCVQFPCHPSAVVRSGRALRMMLR